MKEIDTKGQLCPAPLIATKKALKEAAVGESFSVITDNQTSFNNLSRFLKDNNTEFSFVENEGIWRLTITRSSGDISKARVEAYCAPEIAHFEKGDFVVVLSSDKMGDGDDDLGLLLMKNFIMVLKDLNNLPQKVVVYNSGVKLFAKDSPVKDHLADLERMGVELLLCATCVNHYSVDIGIGTLSNMFSIAEAMASSGNIIKP